MSDTQETAAGLNETLAATLGPVREHLAAIEKAIAVKERELEELRAVRRTAQSVVRVLDPDEPRPGRKTGGAKKPPSGVDPEYAQGVLDYLRANYNGDGFFAADLYRDPVFVAETNTTGSDPQRINRALNQLHEGGQIRLDHMNGHAKVYKLNPPPSTAVEDA